MYSHLRTSQCIPISVCFSVIVTSRDSTSGSDEEKEPDEPQGESIRVTPDV